MRGASCRMSWPAGRSPNEPRPARNGPNRLFDISKAHPVTPTPTTITAALAGAFAGVAMPMLWPRLESDSMSLVLAFLLVVALPAHAFVLGFGRGQGADTRQVDMPLLKRVGAWLVSAIVAIGLLQALRA